LLGEKVSFFVFNFDIIAILVVVLAGVVQDGSLFVVDVGYKGSLEVRRKWIEGHADKFSLSFKKVGSSKGLDLGLDDSTVLRVEAF
jgi:hypothetical protein